MERSALRDAQALFETGQHQRALETVEDALARPGTGAPAELGALGIRCLLELGRPREALRWTDEQLTLVPYHADLLVLRARAALLTDRVDVADEALAALPVDGHDPAVARLRAEVLLARGDVRSARDWTLRAIDDGGDPPAAWALATIVAAEPTMGLDRFVDRLDMVGTDAAVLAGLVQGSVDGTHRLLDALWHRTPGHPATVATLRFVGSQLRLETALEWSARLRSLGVGEDCPLLGVAANDARGARERVRAACAVARAFADPRAEPLLGLAAAALRAEEVADAFIEMTTMAPDLIETFVLACAVDPRCAVVVAGCLEQAGVGEFGVAVLRHILDSGTSSAAVARTAAALPAEERAGLARHARAAGDVPVLTALGTA